MEWNDRCINYLIKTVEYDIVRYDNENMYATLLELHMNKFKYFIAKGRYKTQEEFEKSLYEYMNSFKMISEPNNLIY
jgi:hypothetical protein